MTAPDLYHASAHAETIRMALAKLAGLDIYCLARSEVAAALEAVDALAAEVDRLREQEFEREDAEVRALSEEDDHAVK